MRLVDTVQLATTSTDGYGDKTVEVLTSVKSLFVQRTGFIHGENQSASTSDAAVYLDPKNPVVVENAFRLEGMYIISDQFGKPSWYQISSVNVGQRKLLNNAIDNIYCRLDKIASPPYVQD